MALRDVVIRDFPGGSEDPLDGEIATLIEHTLNIGLARVADLPQEITFASTAMDLRSRLYQVGIQREPALLVVGRKGERLRRSEASRNIYYAAAVT